MKAHWVIGIVMAAGMHAQPQVCKLDVYLVPGVPLPAGILGDASRKAAAMFLEIGVTLRMRDGIPARDPSDSCGAPIVIQLEDSIGFKGRADILAYANPYKTSGTSIHVFADRVLHLNLHPHAGFANALLAHVIVHEITHVLENLKHHSDEGIMKATWTLGDYDGMRRRPLTFAPEDVRLIHEGLAKHVPHSGAD
jgi:hypothetical protein